MNRELQVTASCRASHHATALLAACSGNLSIFYTPKSTFSLMETAIPNHQKIERLEAEKRQLEDRIRQLKHAAQTAERKRLTRAKIILGSLMLRNHSELLAQLIAEASPQDGELLRSVFPNAARKDSPQLRRLSKESLWK
jgi:hypothetical protein